MLKRFHKFHSVNFLPARHRYNLLLAVGLFTFYLFIISCKKENRWDCFKRTGSIVTEERVVAKFDSIQVEDNINVFLTNDTIQEVRIEAGENLLPLIKTEVYNRTLILRNDNKCNWVRSYKKKINAYITINNIKRITHTGNGKVITTNPIESNIIYITLNGYGILELELNSNTIYCDIHGGSDLILKGTSGVNVMWITGNNWIWCSGLKTNNTYLTTSTSGNCYVYATKNLGVTINGSGNVYYTGNPTDINIEISGSGQLIAN